MFFTNKNVKERHQLLWILKEFPWLWAVKDSWLPGFNHVRVQRVKDGYPTDVLVRTSESYPIWVKCRMGDLEKVVQGVKQAGQNLAEAAVGTISSGYCIEYLVVPGTGCHEYVMDLVILRATSSAEDLHRFLCDLAFPDLKKRLMEGVKQ